MEKRLIEFDEEVIYCKRCHRRLKDIDAKRLGYGKICYSKINNKNIPFLFEIDKGE